jgi:CheY-like chemotaxis protein
MTSATAEARMRVLVVDDDADTIESTALLFQMQGHETKTARNGVAAIEQTKAFCPHLILLDIAMPKMDGFQVLRELRGIHCVAESTIVAVTGYANVADRRQCAEAGFDLHFPKPLDFGILEQLVWLLQQSSRLRETSSELAAVQSDTLTDLIRTTIQMANTFLDVSINTTSIEVRERCIGKAEKTHRKMTEFVARSAPQDTELMAALDELQWRYKRLRL